MIFPSSRAVFHEESFKMPSIAVRGWLVLVVGLSAAAVRGADPATPADLRRQALEFHLANQQRSGVLVPMYVYPADIHTHPAYNRLIELKRRFETVPFWVIVNPASGPGEAADPNYVKAIDRLRGAGCVILSYVATGYGKRPVTDVAQDLAHWRRLYPKTHGVFFDEMIYEDSPAAVAHQRQLHDAADERGYWPTVANPGAETPGRYFEAEVADLIVVHEAATWPDPVRLKGDYFGGYSDYPPSTRAVLVHSQSKFDPAALARTRPYARWFYVTHKPYRPNDPTAANPWDDLAKHLEATCAALAD
jgi:hypothetical protein